MPFYQKGDVRIRYEEAGSGFPLLVTPGGGTIPDLSNGGIMPIGENDFEAIHAVGVGGALFDKVRLQAKDWPGMTELAKQFTAAVRVARG